MKLAGIIQQLQYGEFRMLNFGDGQGVIGQNDVEGMMNHIKLGVAALYKRFAIKEGRLYLELKEGKYVYALKSEHALSNRKDVEKYILDSKADPFRDDINKVEGLYTEGGFNLFFNNPNERLSANMINQVTLEFPRDYVDKQKDLPEVLRTKVVKVVYRAGYQPLVGIADVYEPLITDIDLPDLYLEALLYFVASRVHNPIGMNQEFHDGNNFAAKYEMECQRLEQAGLQMDNTIFNDRFSRNGWC